MSTWRCGWICPRSYFFTAVFLAAASFAVLWGWTPTAICGPILTTGRGTRLIRCSDLLRTRRGWRRLRLAEYAGRRRKAGELACKPDSVIWAFVPFSCVGGVVTVQVRVLVVLANESGCQLYCGRSADDCRYPGPPSPRCVVRRDWGRRGEGGLLGVALAVGAGSPTAGPRRSGVNGRGPLSDLLVEALRCSGARIAHSSQPHAAVTSAAVDLVILSDSLVADPHMGATCTVAASRTFPSGCATASGWWDRW